MPVVRIAVALLLAVVGLTLAPTPAWASGTVTVTVIGQGNVTGDGINCGPNGSPDCSEFYADEVTQDCDPDRKPPCFDIRTEPTVQLTAAPGSNGYGFHSWTGCDSVSGSTCTVTVDASRGVTARYQDIQPPSVGSPHSGGTVRGAVTLASAVGDNAQVNRVEFRVRGVLVATDFSAPYGTIFDTTTVADGPAQLSATAYDAAGNSSQGIANITIDNTAPETSVVSGPADGSVIDRSDVEVGLGANDAGATFSCRLYPSDAAAPDYGACSSSTGHSATDLADGSYVFEAVATDELGNTDPTPAKRTFTVDTVAPDTSITKAPKAVVKTNKRKVPASFKFVATEQAKSFQCKLDKGKWKACSSPAGYRVTKGKHTFKVRATDLAGHRDGTPATFTWKVRRP